MNHQPKILEGKTIISTRPADRTKDLAKFIEDEGGNLIQLPLIELCEVDSNDIQQTVNHLDRFTHIAFSSLFGFMFFYDKIKNNPSQLESFKKLKITSIGYRTSEAIKKEGFNIAFDANAKLGKEFAQKLNQYLSNEEAHILWPTGNLSPDQIANTLDSNVQLTRIDIYKNQMPKKIDNGIIERINNNNYDIIIVASPSALKNLDSLINNKALKLVCIGQTTAEAAIAKGHQPLAMAKEPTNRGLAEAITEYYKSI